ncbi:MAG: hypothetical protein HOG49_23640 [Candidatus Scalindua sp.]|nr:hypothetical protein [Candidatus Scalindua sp.]
MIITKSWTRQISISFFIVLLVIAVMSGCVSYKPGAAYKQWTRTLSQEGIFPVYPPREDVQVGDVYLLPTHPLQTGAIEAIGGLGIAGIWIDNIAWEQERNNHLTSGFYNNRSFFPSTSTESASIKKAMESDLSNINYDIVKVPRDKNPSGNIYKKGDIRQLRQVAFPEFAITNIKKFALNALVPIEVFNVAGGFTSNKIKQVSLKIPSAESYGVPAELLTRELFERESLYWENGNLLLKSWDFVAAKKARDKKNMDEIPPGVRGINKSTVAMARNQFDSSFLMLSNNPDMSGNDRKMIKKGLEDSKNFVWIALINEVFYARAIDISIRTKKAKGGATNIQPMTNTMLKELSRMDKIMTMMETKKSGTSRPTPVTSRGGGATTGAEGAAPAGALPDTEGRSIVGTTEIKAGDNAFELVKAINKFNTDLGNQSVPGASLNLVSVSDSAYGLRRIYDRPIAVGVRGLILQINLKKSTPGALNVELDSFPQ